MKLSEILKIAYRLKVVVLVPALCIIFSSFSTAHAMVSTQNPTVGTESDTQTFPENKSASDSLYRAVNGHGPDSTSVRIFGTDTVMPRTDIPELVLKYSEEMPIIVDNMNMSYEEFSEIPLENLFFITIGSFFYPDEIDISTGWRLVGSNKLIVPEDNPYHAVIEKKKAENNGVLPYIQRQDPMKTCRIFIDSKEIENDGHVIDKINPTDIESTDYDKAQNILYLKLKK